jgi:hypothetical protein
VRHERIEEALSASSSRRCTTAEAFSRVASPAMSGADPEAAATERHSSSSFEPGSIAMRYPISIRRAVASARSM